MKHAIHLTKTEKILLLSAAVFAAIMLLLQAGTAKHSWSVSAQFAEPRHETVAPVNINTATREELTAVEGIGETLAGRIVEYRREHGAFSSVEELDNVKGIGPSLLENIRNLVCTEDTE